MYRFLFATNSHWYCKQIIDENLPKADNDLAKNRILSFLTAL